MKVKAVKWPVFLVIVVIVALLAALGRARAAIYTGEGPLLEPVWLSKLIEPVEPAWLHDARAESNGLLTSLLRDRARQLARATERLDQGYEIPALRNTRVRVKQGQVMLEYRF